mgnify:FL=1|tara:strand:- start:187 stop:504 length:318 start_codon:yes stop_codon:yes gene_type:complete
MNLLQKINVNNQYIKYKIPFTYSSYLIKWLPNSKTEIHSHNGQECKFFILKGNLVELRYLDGNLNTHIKHTIIKPLRMNHINDSIGSHQMLNLEEKIKWSIHHYY